LAPQFKIVPADEQLVERFLAKLVKGAAQFRYFQKRPVSIIQNHLTTAITLDPRGGPVAYGHLEKEDGKLWLGLAVADDHLNQGLGKSMLNFLVNDAADKGESAVCLAVDKDNIIAQGLYQSAGFAKIGEYPAYYLFELTLA
jgi:ribosomal protein S18 acetylase RimI-like enzyme